MELVPLSWFNLLFNLFNLYLAEMVHYQAVSTFCHILDTVEDT